MAKKALGKGLGAIISSSQTPADDIEKEIIEDWSRIVELKVGDVKPNPDQPRTHFDEEAIQGLSESIKSVGLIQPIVVRKVEDEFIVIAGERRLRACKLAGKKTIKAIVMEAGEEQNVTVALIENIQRSDLDPIEEAKAYKVLVNRFKLKQQDIARKVGKDRATISNALRLLNLPEDIQENISVGQISTGHAKVLLSVSGVSNQRKLMTQIVDKGLSVRALEQMISSEDADDSKGKPKKSSKNAQIKKMEEGLITVLGTKVEIRHTGGKGKIEISYYSLDDFGKNL